MLNSEKIVSTLALIISLVTLGTLMHQSKLMREHQEKSSFPKLETWNNNLRTKYQLEIKNTGLGPAILEEIQIVFRDSIYDIDPASFAIQYRDSLPGALPLGTSSLAAGRIIEPGSAIWPINISSDSIRNHPIAKLFRTQQARLVLKYSSVYEQYWIIDGIGRSPELLNEEPKVIRSLLGD